MWGLFFFFVFWAIVLSNVIRETKAISDWSVFQSAFFSVSWLPETFHAQLSALVKAIWSKSRLPEKFVILQPPLSSEEKSLVPRVYVLQTLHSS